MTHAPASRGATVEGLKRFFWKWRERLSFRALMQVSRRLRERVLAYFYALQVLGALRRIQFETCLARYFSRTFTGKRMLLLAWLFPPEISGGVYRPTALLKYGVNDAWRCTVLAGPAPATPSAAGVFLSSQIPAHVHVERQPRLKYTRQHALLPQIDGGMLNVIEGYRRGIALHRAAPPSIVLASGPPFHNFLAATLLARRFRARLVLDYRDEWSESPFEWVQGHPDNRRWEAWCLARADLVVFTTQSQLEHQVRAFPQVPRDRCTVLPNGWDPDDFTLTERSSKTEEDNRIVLAFVGNFGSLGSPEQFLADLAAALEGDPLLRARFQLHVIGQKTDAAVAALDRFPWRECIVQIAQLPKPEACHRMADAQGLLLLNPPQLARYIPGKLFEYIATGTSILLYGSGGEVGQILEQCRSGTLVEPGDVAGLREALLRLEVRRDRSPQANEWLAAHTRQRIARRTIEVFEQLASSDNAPVIHDASGLAVTASASKPSRPNT